MTADSSYLWVGALRTDFGMYLTRWECTTRVVSNNNGSNYWIARLAYQDASNTATNLSSVSTATDANNTPTPHGVTLGIVLSGSARRIITYANKTGAPGTLIAPSALYYRLIVT